jgi:hypothetical protein
MSHLGAPPIRIPVLTFWNISILFPRAGMLKENLIPHPTPTGLSKKLSMKERGPVLKWKILSLAPGAARSCPLVTYYYIPVAVR